MKVNKKKDYSDGCFEKKLEENKEIYTMKGILRKEKNPGYYR